MEEVDSIILHFLRQLNVKIPDDIKSLTDLSPATIIGAVSTCLNTINPTLKAPTILPPGISHRIELAAHVASLCKDLGYKSEVGYQTFLYHNESDLRKVFMFLIECLPTEQTIVKPALPQDNASVLWINIRKKIADELDSLWVPFNTKSSQHMFEQDDTCSNSKTDNIHDEAYLMNLLKKIKEIETIKDNKNEHIQTKETNALSPFSPVSSHSGDITVKEVSQVELKCLKEEAINLREQLGNLAIEKNSLQSQLFEIIKANENMNAEIKQFQCVNNLSAELGISSNEDLDKVIDRLNMDLHKLHMKSDECTQKNMEMKTEIENVKRELSQCNSERTRRIKTIEELRATVRELKEQYKNKEHSNLQLRKEYEKLNRTGIKRSFYTKKILEIIGNVAKQKIEIHKILGDTRQLQKEINNLNGQLDRSFSVADETLFRDAKKDDQSKKTYKLLALLHSECNTIVSLVNDTGILSRELVDLEDQIEAEKSKRTEDTLKRVKFDLGQMQKEIESLGSNTLV